MRTITTILFVWLLSAAVSFSVLAAETNPPESANGFAFLNTSIENGSPCYWDIGDDGTIHVYLVYDYERDSSNRANGHWHFQIQAKKGSDLTFVLHNFNNVWNGKRGVPVSDKTSCYLSQDGKTWTAIQTEFVDGDKIKFQVYMESDTLYAARLEPYRISDLDRFLNEIRFNSHVKIETIGRTVEGRELEIVRAGDPDAPYRVFLRARAHAWEPGGNWVVQGMIRRLIGDDEDARRFRETFCLYVMPMANKDGVARGWTRFNVLGMDLNRKWDKTPDPFLCPENSAMEAWLSSTIFRGKRPHLAIDFHNDEGGRLHVSRPDIDLDAYLKRMERLETLMRECTWFTEGSTKSSFRNPGSLGEGLLERFGVDAVIQELNCNWIAGLNKIPMGKDWELLGEQYCEVFYRYFSEYEK